MIDRIETFFRRLRRRLSRSEWAIWLLGLPVSKKTADEPGLLMIQIDGLSRRQMERAMERGRLPFLRRLIHRENYEPRTFYSGLPSTTPAVQGELFYGERAAVPAFSFLERETRQISTMFRHECAKAVEDQLKEKSEGLLKGGSSWSNIYTGGASSDETHFCAARLAPREFFQRRALLRGLTFPLLHFPSLVRIGALLVVEFLIAFWDMCHGVFHGEKFFQELKFVFMRVFVCIALREVATIGVKIDLARGLPIVHMNFLGYDEQAHRRGPSSAFAHWSLKGIDRSIKNIFRAAQRSGRRDYEVWIYSDHGHEATRFFHRDGADLEEVVRALMPSFNSGRVTSKSDPKGSAPGRPHRLSVNRERQRASACLSPIDEHAAEEGFALAAMGPVGHLYFFHPEAHARRREFAERLVREGKVPGALVRDDGGKVEWFHSEGDLIVPGEAVRRLVQPKDLQAQVARDLAGLCEQKCAGDIVLLGWDPAGGAVSFVKERGAHAGPGPDETQGFILVPALTRFPEPSKEFVRPGEVRAGALHLLGRKRFSARTHITRTVAHRLRVMTYNVHSCRGMDGRTSPRRIARVIERYDPDIVALQELDFGRVRSQRHDQPRLIAEELGMHLQFCPTVIDHDEQYGHAILSHLPLKTVRTERLCRHTQTRHVEPRGALWVQLELEGQRLNLMNTHFGLNRRERSAQAAELLGEGWIGEVDEDEPLIVCGDFNMFPRSEPYRALVRRLRDVQSHSDSFVPLKTFTTFHPLVRIDHIFVSRHFVAKKVLVPRNELTRVASDHLPLIVDLIYQSKETLACSRPQAV